MPALSVHEPTSIAQNAPCGAHGITCCGDREAPAVSCSDDGLLTYPFILLRSPITPMNPGMSRKADGGIGVSATSTESSMI